MTQIWIACKGGAGLRQFISFARPFSEFKFVADRFGNEDSIRRCLSLARAKGCQTMVVERIQPIGFLKDENEELASMGCWTSGHIYRLSFFSKHFKTILGLMVCPNDAFLGYAILKCDGESRFAAQWYVYESVFSKYAHEHNCVSRPATYAIKVAFKTFKIKGILYCQQNGLNKSCAHVAIRSILSRLGKDIPYRKMNEIASQGIEAGKFCPHGLNAYQVTNILESCGLNVRALDYTQQDNNKSAKDISDFRRAFPFQKIVYQGIESGMGVLLGFKLDGEDARHMIPIYGHTFNQDTWVSDADAGYFKITTDFGYVPSEKWTSSFIGHDDNFGPCFCIPRFYLPAEKVDYVAEVLLDDVQYTGMQAEAAAFPLLKWFVKQMDDKTIWQKRLKQAFSRPFPNVVVRALCVDSKTYFDHLQEAVDWQGNRDQRKLVEEVRKAGSVSKFWVVEFSFPQLFSSSKRKLGEIVLDATKPIETDDFVEGTSSVFLLARLPSVYFIASGNRNDNNRLVWDTCKSQIESHVPLMSLADK
ncbi:MAG: hypothetical protein J6Y19_02705 [Kiritimatiellae bacterium]|nr:hypothetical protein [Kiritimatiellia bacterium]